MIRALTAIDHAIVGVRDLEDARIAWEAMGFTTSARGRHIGWGTGNYCIMFPDDYVELLGVVDPAVPAGGFETEIARREGLMGVVFGSADPAGTVAALEAAGIAAEGPKDLARQLELPEGPALPRFALVTVPEGSLPGLSGFFCHHLSPGLLRRAEWMDHPNGARGLAGVVVAVADPLAIRFAYERLAGAGAVTETDDLVTVRLGGAYGHTLVFATPDRMDDLYPGRGLPSATRLPMPIVLRVRVESVDRAANHLASRQVPFEEEREALLVDAGAANGVAVEFLA